MKLFLQKHRFLFITAWTMQAELNHYEPKCGSCLVGLENVWRKTWPLANIIYAGQPVATFLMLSTVGVSLYDVIVLYVGQPYMVNLVYAQQPDMVNLMCFGQTVMAYMLSWPSIHCCQYGVQTYGDQ